MAGNNRDEEYIGNLRTTINELRSNINILEEQCNQLEEQLQSEATITDNLVGEKKKNHLPSSIQLCKKAILSTVVDDLLAFKAKEISYHAENESSREEKFSRLESALNCYPLSLESWNSIGYYYLKNDELDNSIISFETAVTVARKINPEWNPQRTASLGCAKRCPYVKSMKGLALAYEKKGIFEKCIEVAETLYNCGNSELESKLCSWYLHSNRWDDAYKFISELKGDRDHLLNCEIEYSMVLILYKRLRQCHNFSASSLLDDALAVAFKKNSFVPDLLFDLVAPVREGRNQYLVFKEGQAFRYAEGNHSLWHSIPGAVSWLTYMKSQYGSKPDEQTIIELLRQDYIDILLRSSSDTQDHICGTQAINQMIGTDKPEFQLPNDITAPHVDGDAIYVQIDDEYYNERGFDINTLWQSFVYSDVIAVPFWNVLLRHEQTKYHNTLTCKSEEEKCVLSNQEGKKSIGRNMWGELKVDCISTICDFLNLKEKAKVSSLNKVWREGATSGRAVCIDPEIVGPNIDAVLTFVSFHFRNLIEFSLKIAQDDFYGINDKPRLQLNGKCLNLFFKNCPSLRSVDLSFDECTEGYVYDIVKHDSGLDTLHRHSSLDALTLQYVTFENNESLCNILNTFTNLKMLSLTATWNMENSRMLDLSDIIKSIATMKQLQSLELDQLFRLTDSNLLFLIPILRNLHRFHISREYGDTTFNTLTDESLKIISENCTKLQSLGLPNNNNFTIGGICKIVKACPLRELFVRDTCVTAHHLKQIVELSSSLFFVEYNGLLGRNKQDHKHLQLATEFSGGKVIFSTYSYYRMYAPTFDLDLLSQHKKIREMIENVKANASNGWNKWAGYKEK